MLKISKNIRNQRGEATMIIVAVIALAIIGVAIWYAVSHKTKSVATTPAAKATQSACMKVYNDNTICNFAVTAAAFNTTSYTATATSTSGGTSQSLTIKSDGKGNTEITTSSGGQNESIVTLGGNSYVQDGSSAWVEYPSGSTSTPTSTSNPTSDVKFSFASGAQESTFKKVGTSSCGSLTCAEYTVTDPTNAGNTFTVWIDTTNYQLQRWQGQQNDGSTLNMTFAYGPITISTPSPVTSL